MPGELGVRDATAADAVALRDLYMQAFPEEDLIPLVLDLLSGSNPVVSLVAQSDRTMGHAVFTICAGLEGLQNKALLGPVAVLSVFQRQGVGLALIRTGLERLRTGGVDQVFVLGDPAYYGRFGFGKERFVTTPCTIPTDWVSAWQSLWLGPPSCESEVGKLIVPQPWQEPGLWQP